MGTAGTLWKRLRASLVDFLLQSVWGWLVIAASGLAALAFAMLRGSPVLVGFSLGFAGCLFLLVVVALVAGARAERARKVRVKPAESRPQADLELLWPHLPAEQKRVLYQLLDGPKVMSHGGIEIHHLAAVHGLVVAVAPIDLHSVLFDLAPGVREKLRKINSR